MYKLVKELRRREVFRTTGLYVGVAWIVVEVLNVLVAVHNLPEWVLQGTIILAVIGLPVTIVLAWIFDITEKGIEVQAETTDTTVIPFGGRRMDFVVIGVLTVALVFSAYLKIAGEGNDVQEAIEPLSILIADFDNQTGDPQFEGSLEQALQIGLEGAHFVAAYDRDIAKSIAQELQSTSKLDVEIAQRVAAREGIRLVLVGTIAPVGNKFDVVVKAIVPLSGQVIAEADATAASKLDVLSELGNVAADLSEQLGDDSVGRAAL
jgi:hypothetical protein